MMKKGNLLIVDDEPIIVKRLKFNLEEYADNVFTAENGLIALEVLKEQDIHCVICDINMPKLNGVEVIKKIRSDENEVPFIFYTGHGNQELMMQAVKYGAFDFLNKPNLDGLEDVVMRGLSEGYNKKESKTDDAYISDYQKLLDDIGD
jgi:DNA-binding NtrC family response regulator